jgi:hypothetical protein
LGLIEVGLELDKVELELAGVELGLIGVGLELDKAELELAGVESATAAVRDGPRGAEAAT